MKNKPSNYWSGSVGIAVNFLIEIDPLDCCLNERQAVDKAESRMRLAVQHAGEAGCLECEERLLFTTGFQGLATSYVEK